MVFYKTFPYLWIVLTTIFKGGHGVKNTSTLIAELKSRSDCRVSPNDISGVPVIVNVSMLISNFHEMYESKMEFGFDAFIRKMWNDPRLAFSNGPKKVHLNYDTAKSFIWMPDLFFEQSTTTQITESFKRDAAVLIKPNGDIFASLRTSMKHHCQMDLRNFPLDKQSCDFRISTYLSTADEVKLNWIASRVMRKKFPPGFALRGITSTEDTMKYSAGAFDALKLTFYLDRLRAHYIVLAYIPSVLLVLLSCLLFWLPLTAVMERFIFGALLVLGLNQVLAHSQDQAPQVGYIKAIDVWVVSCYTFVCVALAEVIILYFVSKKMKIVKHDVMELVSNDELSESTEQVSTRQSTGIIRTFPLEKLGVAFKVLYPSSFLMFNIVYWATFA